MLDWLNGILRNVKELSNLWSQIIFLNWIDNNYIFKWIKDSYPFEKKHLFELNN